MAGRLEASNPKKIQSNKLAHEREQIQNKRNLPPISRKSTVGRTIPQLLCSILKDLSETVRTPADDSDVSPIPSELKKRVSRTPLKNQGRSQPMPTLKRSRPPAF
jgi:hypothetical protein